MTVVEFLRTTMAMRVPTLPAAVVPVLVGSGLAAHVHAFHAGIFLAVLAVSLLIQIGTNQTNDLADFRRGTDCAPQKLRLEWKCTKLRPI